MELKEGMYVRTKSFKGFPSKIGRITKVEYNAGIDNETYIALDNDEDKNRRWTEDWLIGEPSFKIIDLIEEGDYVNGFEVMEADWNNDDLEYEEGLAIPMYSSDDLDVIENWQPLKYMKIKSIVTKEQFSSMECRIGE